MMLYEGFVGIKNSYLKNLLVKKGRYRIKELDVDALAYDCKRLIDLLERHERKEDLSESLYFKISRFYFKRAENSVRKKIERFLDLYEKIKRGDRDQRPIVVTVNKARLDGSHRVSIFKFLDIRKIEVKEIYTPKYLLWIIGREVAKRKEIYEKFRGEKAYLNGNLRGKILFTDFVRRDPLSFTGDCYHILDTGEIIKAGQCYLQG